MLSLLLTSFLSAVPGTQNKVTPPTRLCPCHHPKTRLAAVPVLSHFDEEAETEILTNASSQGLGAVLVRLQDGVERMTAYASRTFSKAEVNDLKTEK